ncbi:hypothetical protein JB92DRAFT_1809470 [Gautieria morchelliformis]|nr:hypothetical protein JB92DRAFT_1809470 [Gautieria morchelliformis]
MVWPGRWGLTSIDARCLEAIIYLHLALPAHYSTVEPADPDQSPNAQLPFLTHGQIIVSPSLSSIHPYPTSFSNLQTFRMNTRLTQAWSPQTSMQDSVRCSSHRGQLGEATLKRS